MNTISTPSGRRLGRWAGLAMALGFSWLLQPTAAQAQCNQLVWQDEFDTPGNFDKWQVYNGDGCNVGNCNFGNAELQVYRPANATVAGGVLNIATRYENSVEGGRTYNYTSAKLQSKVPATGGLQTFKYGRIEARMKLPSAQGAWPAFWMLADPGNWPFTGEIDIMEAKHKNPRSVGGTIHYDAGGWHFTGRDYISSIDLSLDFHVYAVEWGPDQIKWFVDGNLFHTATPKTTFGGGWPFNDGNFYIILNTAVGGPGTAYTGFQQPTPADFPVNTQVDYVRVYKGTYNYAVFGAEQVHQGDQNKTYRMDAITGGTYTWSVPSGATITSGQGTNAIQVNFASGAVSGNVTASVAVSGCATATYTKAITVTPALQLDRVYEDYEANRVITYGTVTGTLTQAVANPSAVINTSAAVGKYVRNSSEQYDVLYVRNLGISNANDFISGRRKVFIDVYSTAPAGSKVTMQFENSQVTTATNFPAGRHSAYRAYTTRQNAWETLEFEFEKSLDANTSIFSINNVAFLFQPATNSAATFYVDNLLIKKQPEAPVVSTEVLLNYDGTSKLTFNAAGTNGAYTAPTANPGAAGVNTSANVARYVRNATQQYDVLFLDAGAPGTVIQDAALFKNQTYQLQVDVYTSAPVGTPINITLQNKALAAPLNSFPAGRNSTYLANTTRQNQWETLTFAFNNAPDAGTANVAIDQLAVLFNSGFFTGETFYLDNLRIAKKATPTYSAATTFENYDAIRNLPLRSANGTYVAAANNPSATGINTSAKVGQYTRNTASQYDALTLTSTQIKDGSAYVSGQKVFAMDVYTSAPVGTVVSWQLESSAASTPGNYPSGRHSIYQAVIKQTNAWHTLTFSYANSPDAGTADADIDNVVMLFSPNSTNGSVYYIDNLRSLSAGTTPTNVAPTVSLTSPANGASFTAPASITINANAADSDGTISKVEFYNGTTLLNTDTASPYSYTWTGVGTGTYSLTAKATDNAGAVTTSTAVSVTVPAAPTAQPIPGTIEAESYTAQQGTDKEATTDTGGGQNVDWYETGDWLDYSVNVASAGQYTVGIRVASANGGATLQLRNSAGTVLGSVNVGNTGGWQSWQTQTTTVTLPAGVQTLRLYASASTGTNVNWLSFTAVTTNTPPTVSLTSPAAGATFTAPASITINANAADANGTVSSVAFYNGTTLLGTDTSSPYSYTWTGVAAGTYSITARATDNAGAVTTASAVSVTVSNTQSGQTIPGTIEAESYAAMLGIQTEATTDTGGGLNVGYIETGDWMDYAVNVTSAGSYTVGFRVASQPGGATLQLRNSAGSVLGSVNVGATGGWQSWQTQTATVSLPAGAQTLRVYAAAGGVNVNWLSFAAVTTNTPPTVSLTSPAAGATFTAPASITINANAADANGTVSSVAFYNGTTLLGTDTSAPYSYTWTGVAAGTYSLTARATDNGGAVTTSSAVSVTVSNASTGSYCAVTSDFSYGAVSSGGNVTITFHPLGATAGGNLAILYLRQGTSGAYPGYTMTKNAAGDFTYTLPVANGTLVNLYFTYQVGAGGPERNNAATPFSYTVGTACSMQARTGTALANHNASSVSSAKLYPNPASSQLRVETLVAAETLTVTDGLGRVVLKQQVGGRQLVSDLNISSLNRGVYFLTIRSSQGTEVQKFIKQ
ncbi:carbohydrate-binding protein [Hymenobacter lutimineralis]|uniref:Carbohydrate-binding protein n=1 Tax=Hymenobacter lutimineralis TaxID=2606448 RepID=A0A5D6V3P7_9BACT|nr:Ig-like domain-containing protein [Hymenobacter lutimineralis]TYZ10130.1 carbohydrate-binding protein [Hymenobacter lutimineralis]